MLRVVIPGSFDPPTNGHLNLIERASEIYDKVEVVIAENPSKAYTFSAEERYDMMVTLMKHHENVDVHIWRSLVVEFAEKVGAKIIIRGVRALADFEYEFELSMINRGLNPSVETIFMPTDQKYFVLRSSAIKDLARFDGDISSMVPDLVATALKKRLTLENDS